MPVYKVALFPVNLSWRAQLRPVVVNGLFTPPPEMHFPSGPQQDLVLLHLDEGGTGGASAEECQEGERLAGWGRRIEALEPHPAEEGSASSLGQGQMRPRERLHGIPPKTLPSPRKFLFYRPCQKQGERRTMAQEPMFFLQVLAQSIYSLRGSRLLFIYNIFTYLLNPSINI